jgi:hypothetical protein
MTSSTGRIGNSATIPELTSIDDVVDEVAKSSRPVFVRFSKSPPDGLDEPSVDHETGLELPGLSVNPLDAPTWWRGRELREWVIRRICTYAHLQIREPDRACWLVQGNVVDRGPDNEPLIIPEALVAKIAHEVVAECRAQRVRAGLEEPDELDGPEWQT